jgi:hypothetical protein
MVKMKRKAMGRRGDLILRKGSAEYGCAEAGAKDEGLWGTEKLVEKGVKAAKVLKDMLNHLCDLVDKEECYIRQLSTIGYILSGTLMTSKLRIGTFIVLKIHYRAILGADDYGFAERILLPNNKVKIVLNAH